MSITKYLNACKNQLIEGVGTVTVIFLLYSLCVMINVRRCTFSKTFIYSSYFLKGRGGAAAPRKGGNHEAAPTDGLQSAAHPQIRAATISQETFFNRSNISERKQKAAYRDVLAM